MSRREIKACDTIDEQTGVCNREATGTCLLCERDVCSNHVSSNNVTVRTGITTGGAQVILPLGGWLDVQPCRACLNSLERILKANSTAKLTHILPTKEVFIEALRALLAAETMKGPAGGA